ncbi:MAG: hypothetical protein KatS3mg131_2790 [Candidatus Tectimicrobiota bacterium]|nr:MAG: hypothetical protein KatS3mg131_2790 [Candidatus Tectomicrobia bacterium]
MAIATRDTAIGSTLPSLSKHVTQAMINAYGQVNGDRNLIHYDGDYARARGFRDAIAHGLLTFAFVSEMLARYFGPRWTQGGKVRVKFTAPVYPGDVVTAGGQVTASRPHGDGQFLTVEVWCDTQDGRRVLVGEASAVVA